MKILGILLLGITLVGSAMANEKLMPAAVVEAKSNHMFPVETYELVVEVPCFTAVAGELQTITADQKTVIGVLLKQTMAPTCLAIPTRVTVVFSLESAFEPADVTILGAPSDLKIGQIDWDNA